MIGTARLRSAIRHTAMIVAIGCAGIGFVVPAPAHAAAGIVVLRDDLQRTVVVPRDPRRVISVLPSLTETVCALGACDRLVATGDFDDWPASVRSLPKVGGLDDVNIERIVALRPDLVLLSNSQRVAGRLGQLGIVSFALETDRYADIARTITRVGALLGVPARAAALNAHISAAVRAVSEQALARRHGPGPKVYFEVDPGPYAAGPQSYIGELLSMLGARNIVAARLGAFPLLNPEYIVRRDPDVIFVSRTDARHLAERPGWAQIKAVREHHICTFPDAVRETVMRPGPRVAEGMRAIAACLARMSS